MSGLTGCHRAIVRQGIRWSAAATMVLLATTLALNAEDVRTFNSVDVPVNIPEVANPVGSQSGTTRSVLQVSGIRTTVSRITVSVYATHAYTSDLVIRLVPPDPVTGQAGTGTGILLMDNIFLQVANPQYGQPNQPEFLFLGENSQGAAVSGIGTGLAAAPLGRVVFADAGVAIDRTDPTPHINGGVNNRFNIYLRSGTYAPAQNLAVFNGLSGTAVNGTWTLLIEDEAALDQGTLRAWSMTITEPGPHTWTGEGDTDNWSEEENWVGGNEPDPAEVAALLIFPADAVGPTVNDLGDISVGELNIEGAYSFSANDANDLITLTANAVVTANATTDIAMNMPIEMVGTATFTVSGVGGLILNGELSNNTGGVGAPVFAGTGPKTIASATNDYTGVTTVSAGILDVTSSPGLGTGAAGTVIITGATLRLAAGVTTQDTITVQGTGLGDIGSLVFSGDATVNGLTLVAGIPGSVNVLNDGDVVVNTVTAAATAAAHTLSITNTSAGTIAINGALPATTTLNLDGGGATFGPAQPNIAALSLRNGADVDFVAGAAIGGGITVGASGDTSVIDGGTISLGGGSRALSVANGAASPDLTIDVDFTTGSLNKGGAGTVLWNNSTSTANLTVSAGEVTGSGSVGNLSVGSAKFFPTGAFGVTNLVLGDDSWLVFDNFPINASGTVTLQGGILQPLDSGVVIDVNAGNANGTFAHYAGAPVNYLTGGDGNDVSFTASGGATVSFTPTLTYSGAEGDDLPLQLTVNSVGGAMTIAIVSSGGGLTPGGDFTLIDNFAINGATNIPLDILDDFIDEGTETGQLIIIPLTGGVAGNPNGNATLTITDNDKSDTKACGFGTGLTVFLLLGFGLLLHVRLRRP
jgi:autotransporter-associated beta strand protein